MSCMQDISITCATLEIFRQLRSQMPAAEVLKTCAVGIHASLPTVGPIPQYSLPREARGASVLDAGAWQQAFALRAFHVRAT